MAKSQSGRTFARHVAPFAPVALALAMHAVPHGKTTPTTSGGEVSTAVAEKCEGVTDFQDCHSRYPTGCSAAAGYDAALNLLKNERTAPSNPVKYLTQQDYANLDAKIPHGLTRGNHGQFATQLKDMGEGSLYGVIGYLYYAQHTGAESSNCDLTAAGPPNDPDYSNVDYHIGIGFDPSVAQQLRGGGASVAADGNAMAARRKPTPKPKPSPGGGSGMLSLQQSSVIVEMTPHYRFEFQPGNWTYDNLKKAVGRQVRVVGQLIVDSEHNVSSQNCATAKTAADKQSCWRMSVWELHPVARFQVCNKGTSDCSANDSAEWIELDQL